MLPRFSFYFILLYSTAMPSHCLLYHGEAFQRIRGCWISMILPTTRLVEPRRPSPAISRRLRHHQYILLYCKKMKASECECECSSNGNAASWLTYLLLVAPLHQCLVGMVLLLLKLQIWIFSTSIPDHVLLHLWCCWKIKRTFKKVQRSTNLT